MTPANYSTVVAAAERDKRTKYSFIPNLNDVQRPGLFVPLIFSQAPAPLEYVSDETARLACSGVDTSTCLSAIRRGNLLMTGNAMMMATGLSFTGVSSIVEF